MENLTVAIFMKTRVISVLESASLKDCLRLFDKHQISSLPVYNSQSKLVGIITMSDILKALSRQSGAHFLIPHGLEYLVKQTSSLLDIKVKDAMTSNPIHIPSGTPVPEACKIMLRHSIRRVLIMDKGFLKGILSLHDLLKQWNQDLSA